MNVLEVAGLTAGHGARTVLHGIDLTLSAGEWFCLLGPNGSGKSTLIACLGGRIRPTTGCVRLCGADMHRQAGQARAKLGYAVAPEHLPGLLTGRQALEAYAMARNLNAIDAEVRELATQFRLDPSMDQCIDTWSLGMRQKLAILMALLGDPALVLLDEVFNGLDPQSTGVLRAHLQQRTNHQRCAVLLATHNLDAVCRLATGAGWLEEGRLRHCWSGTSYDPIREGGFNALESLLGGASTLPPPAA